MYEKSRFEVFVIAVKAHDNFVGRLNGFKNTKGVPYDGSKGFHGASVRRFVEEKITQGEIQAKDGEEILVVINQKNTFSDSLCPAGIYQFKVKFPPVNAVLEPVHG